MARPARRPGNLPAEATSFIGRRRELAEVRSKLGEARLVSLVGPGGVGKTRLALRAAAGLRRGFRDGGWLAELADVVEPALVSHAVLAALKLRDQAATEPLALLRAFLRDKELLLVVDNCERLLDAAAAVVTDLMRAAPGLRVLATSREPLSAPGEHVVAVPPLELPAARLGPGEPLARVRQNEAVRLFTERAAAASGSFELTAANQAAVAGLCRRLDGLPLAIELAAVRTRALAPEQILDRLADRFGLLTGGSRAAQSRHQTLRTTIEWSHDLLAGGERAVLRRSRAFAGRFTLEDAEAVCASPDVPAALVLAAQVLDALSSLVDKSLVMKEDVAGVACYRLHETMREFAGLKLAEAGEEDAVGLRCAEYYRSRCQRLALEGRYRLLDWLAWADLEIDNVRAVLQRCRARGDGGRGIDLTVSLGWFWVTRATTEGIRWLDEFLDRGDGGRVTRGWAWFIRGFIAVLKADPVAASPALDGAIAVARRTRQPGLLTEALAMASIAANMSGDRASARRLLDEAQATAAGLDYRPGPVAVLQARALDGFFRGDLDAVRSAAAQGARVARDQDDLYAREMMLLNLGSAALIAGDPDEAKPLLTESLTIAGRIDDRVARLYLLDALGCHAALSGRPRLAARLLGAADTARTEAGADAMPFLAEPLARARESAVAALGAERFAGELEAGRRLDRDAVLALALGRPPRADEAGRPARAGEVVAGPSARGPAERGPAERGPAERGPAARGPAVRDPAGAGLIGRREADVARLVADGLTNKQIGVRLFISERTVDSHVRSILNKLGVSSRAQIAAWIASPDP